MATAAVAAVSYITGLTGTAAVAATAAIATVGAVSAVAMLTMESGAPKAQGQLNQLSLASNAARRLQIGTRGNGGSLVDWYTYGDKNQFAELVVYLGEGPMGDLTGVWSSGRKVYSGTLTHGNRVQLTEFDSPDGRAWIEYYDGRPGQTASARLVSATSGAWASSNVGEGCAYVIVSLKWDPDTMPAIASFFVETEGAKLYDRRLDTTAGGSGSHRLTDPSTWEVSSNPAVALDHYMLGRYRNASSEPVFGIGIDPSLVNYSRFVTQANLCDEAVSVTQTQWYTTTQPRYEANGIIYSTDKYKDVVLDLCRAMNARAADLGGELGVIDNEAKTAVVDLTDADVVSGTVESYTEKKTRDDLVGGVRGNYQDPDNNYNPTDYPSYTDAAWEAEDDGILEYADFNLDYETDPERAQRLAKMHALRLRRQATLGGRYYMKALILEDGDWFTRTNEKWPSGKTFEVIGSPVLDTESMTVTINSIEVDTSDTAWNAATDPRPVVAPVASSTGLPPQLGSANISIQPTTYVSSGGLQLPAIEVRNLAFDDDIPEALEVEVALDAGDVTPLDDAQTVYMPAGREYGTLAPLLPDTDYLLRSRRVLNERSSDWTAWSAFTTTVGNTALQGEAQRPNLMPPAYHLLINGDDYDFVLTQCSRGASSADNPYLPGKTALIFNQDDPAQTFTRVRFHSADGDTNMELPPGRYGFKIGVLGGGGAIDFYVRLKDATDATVSQTIIAKNGDRPQVLEGVFDITGATVSDYYLEITLLTSGSVVGNWVAYRFQVEAIPDTATGPGAWTDANPLLSTVEEGANVTGDHTSLAVVGQGPGATASEADVMNSYGVKSAASLLPNWDFGISDADGNPAGIELIQSGSGTPEIEYMTDAEVAAAGFSGRAIRILTTDDNNEAGYGFPAIPINDKETYTLTIRSRSSEAGASGRYLRFFERTSALETGETHVSNSSFESFVDPLSNGAMPGTAAVTETFTYTPTPGTKLASFGIYNWSPFSGDLEVDFVSVTKQSNQGAIATADAASVRKVTTSLAGNGDTLLIGSGSVVSQTWHTAASLTLTGSSGGSVELMFSAMFDGIAGAAQSMTNAPYVTVVARIRRNAAILATDIRVARVVSDSSGDPDPWSGGSVTVIDDSPVSDEKTYYLDFKVEDATAKSPTNTVCELLTGRGEFFKAVSYPPDANDFS